jgi:hypothetical protein
MSSRLASWAILRLIDRMNISTAVEPYSFSNHKPYFHLIASDHHQLPHSRRFQHFYYALLEGDDQLLAFIVLCSSVRKRPVSHWSCKRSIRAYFDLGSCSKHSLQRWKMIMSCSLNFDSQSTYCSLVLTNQVRAPKLEDIYHGHFKLSPRHLLGFCDKIDRPSRWT